MRRTALVLRALGLGDLLTAVPALRGLRRALPGHRLMLAAPAALAPLALSSGAVDEVLDTPAFALDPLPYAGRPPVAVNLHGRGPRSTARLRALRPGRLLAYEVPDGPAWDDTEHEVRRWCRLLHHHGIPADPGDLALAAPAAAPAAAGAVLVHPGAASGSRRWPADRYAALARHLTARGLDVRVTGGPAEVGLAERVAAGAGLDPGAVLAGRTTLAELAATVAAARALLCGDTGVAHLATAYGTPSVVLFGPVPPAAWGPPPDRPQHRALWAGRVGDPHAARPDDGLLALSTGEVVAAVDDLLATAAR